MILDPIHAMTSVAFYRRVAAQSWWRSVFYLGYLSALLALAVTAGGKIHTGPQIDAFFVWLGKSMPTLTFANGKLSSNLTAPLTLHVPDYPEIGFVVDTGRVDPVTPKMLEDAKAQAYLASNAFYMTEPQHPGQMKVYDFSKSPDPKPVTIDAASYETARVVFDRFFYPCVFAALLAFLIFWNAGWTILYALVGLLINGLAEGGQSFGALAQIALYAQTAAAFVQGMSWIVGFAVPKRPMVSLILTGTYIWLAIKKSSEPAPAA